MGTPGKGGTATARSRREINPEKPARLEEQRDDARQIQAMGGRRIDAIAYLLLKSLRMHEEDLARRIESGDATHPAERWYDEVPEGERYTRQRNWSMQRARARRHATRNVRKEGA
jgi:hypothetical protein